MLLAKGKSKEMFKKISESLKEKFGRKDDLSRQLAIRRVFDLYKAELAALPPNLRTADPASLKDGVLTVSVESAAAANELRYREAALIEKINAAFGQEIIRRILYRF